MLDCTLPGYRSLRKGRTSVPGQPYLITWTTLDRAPRFDDFDAACRMAQAIAERALWRDAKVMAWVLMPDHVHVLVELGSEDLPALMARVKAVTARAARGDSTSKGMVWAPGFHDRAIRRDVDCRRAARYLVANPVRAGLVESVGQYPFWDAVWL
jgi:REP element-mobilizing transposase RayT